MLRTALVLLALTMGAVRAENEDAPLLGIRHRNETSQGQMTKVSMAGGLEFFVDGKGFDDMPAINQVQFETLQGTPSILIGKGLSMDDQIQSATVLGRLAYTMPSISDLMLGQPIDVINTHYIANTDEYLKMRVKVANTAEATDSSCPKANEKKCEVHYGLRWTPLLHDVVPNQVYWDQEINFIMNPMKANHNNAITADMDPVVHLKIDGTRCDSEGFIDYTTRLDSYRIGGLKTRAGTQHPGNGVPEARFRVGNAYNRDSAKHCNWAGDDCWYVKTHPKIEKISAAEGYTTGGQSLEISGWGLKGDKLSDVSVTVDGVACAVTESTLEKIKCTTGAAGAVSYEGAQPGSPGLRQKVHDPTNKDTNPGWNSDSDGTPVVETKLLTAWEDAYGNYTRALTKTDGWFKAPEAGKYRFYLACDDFCKTRMSSEKWDKTKSDAYTMNQLNIRHWWTNWRQYHHAQVVDDSNKWVSDWVTLEANEYYKVDSWHGEYTGSHDHATVSVEFEKSGTGSHHHATKETQLLKIENEIVYERFNITVKNAMGGKFQIMFVNPNHDPSNKNNPQTIKTREVKDNASASTMRYAIRDFYANGYVWGSDVEVNKYETDDAFTTQAEAEKVTQVVYSVRVKKSISAAGFATASIIKPKETTSEIGINVPYTTSTPPLKGNFIIACKNDDGNEFKSREMSIWTDTDYISMYLHWDIPHLMLKTYVYSPSNDYRENGVDFLIIFQDYHKDPKQCTISSGVTTAIEGGKNLKYTATTPRPYGNNLMFEPVPLEMMYHDATKPQVLVTVNKIAGLCPGFNCDYLYKTAPSEITAQAVAVNGKDITITGTSLPTTDVRVVLGNTQCGTVTASATEITCSLPVLPAAGSWNVEVYEPKGLVPVKSGVAKIDVALVVTSITPSSGLNQLGGDVLTLAGTGFDKDLTKVNIAFSDATKCKPQSGTDVEIKCLVEGFKKDTINTGAPYATTVTVNSVANSDKSVSLLSTKQEGVSVTPNSVSPVLATNVVIALQNTYPGSMAAKEDFTAKLEKDGDASVTRPLYVKAVDNVAKTVTVKFSGALSGVYFIILEGKGVGRIDQANLKLTVESKVTAIAPLTGSYLGGQLVTIDGTNFSTDKLDNPVKAGSNWCDVQTSAVNKITCRVRETKATKTSTGKLSVFLRTQEEAKYDVSNDYNFATPVATVTGLTAAFDASSKTQILTLAGSGFTTEHAKIELWIDGQKQTSTAATATEAKFTLTHLDSETANVVNIYFPDGYPTGYASIKTVAVTPNLVSISPSTGSAGGTMLTVTGTGFGKKTAGLTLVQGDTDVCASVEVTGYGVFRCMTKPGEMLKANALKIKTSAGKFACANSVATECEFEQLTAGSPAVTSFTLTDAKTITVTGTDFKTSGHTASVIFKGVESDSAVIASATSVVATFNNGVPLAATEATAALRFTVSSRRMLSGKPVYLEASSSAKITNAVSVSASSSGLECSFQGGCTYEVTANGLMATLKANAADKIDVCGEPCVMDEATSTAAKVVCTLPHLATTYSASNYKVVTTGLIHDGTWSGTADAKEIAKIHDGKNVEDMTDATSENCYVQVKYKTAHVGVLDEAKFFINQLTDKTPFIGLKFQGSNDGSSFTDLWTIGSEVHEGWNSKDWASGSQPSYNIYRFQGKSAGSCRIGEVSLRGMDSINDNNASYSCTPKLILDNVSSDLGAVAYKATKTPVLTKMSTRFGSILGGESVVFTGTGFSSSATTKVMIDNRECAVTAKTTTTITCTTKNKPYVPDTPKLVINIDGFGNVATMGKTFLYVSKWSDAETWGNDLSPQDDDALSVPKGQHLLFDLDKGPKLQFVNVEGSLIFPPDANANHERTFDAHYILVKNGYMEIGTEENRYTSKFTMTMWSTKFGPQIPIFGNKVIGVNYGHLEMHGIERPITWTDLKTTADAGATTITLNDMKDGKSLDWKVGEEIVIAPTTYSGRDAEQRTIKSITNIDSNPVITFDGPLLTKHYAGVQTYGAGTPNEDTIEMRAEVGLLTRNVKYRGDPDHSPDNQYGAIIICHSPGDESTICRIDSVELTFVGQAFILGSYPIHFHMIGTVHSSYVRNNAIHHSFNRAVTIHGIHYLRVQNNVAYHTMGHTIFIEDGVETKNRIENNLILDVRRSWSLLNTDQTPASIWLTNPDNILKGNHAGGSDRYSYWYDLQTTAIGPSFDPNICPENQKLGEFENNVAHSNGRYGLRIFHNHFPRTKQCDPINYDNTDANYNPPIPAQYKNLVSYKNKRNGAIIERAGAVEWINFKTADNLEVGMEMSRTDDNMKHGYAKIVGGMVIGKSENTEEALDKVSPFGVRTPRTEYFEIKDTKFFNYNWNKAAAFSTCSHCWHDANTDSGGRTMFVSGLKIDYPTTVQKIVSYSTPFMTIFSDADGGMTGHGANSWFLPFYNHLVQPECKQEDDKGGITCDNTVQARRIAIHAMPTNFFGMRMKILKMEESEETSKKTAKTWEAFKDDEKNYGVIPYKQKLKPMNSWSVPYVTGHRYRVHWEAGLDFDSMKMEVSEMWAETDKDVRLVFNFTEKREAVNITTNYGGSGSVQIDNNTLTTLSEWKSGDFQMRNATEVREFEILINGKDKTRNELLVRPLECILGACKLDSVEESNIPGTSKPWSDPKSWPDEKLPAEGDEVKINSDMWIELDLAKTPDLKKLEINGRLSIKQDAGLPKVNLRSHLIWVRAGELLAGTKDKPFDQELTIEMLGHTESETLTLGGTVKAGNKVLASNNRVELYGKPRFRMSRMVAEAKAGDDVIKVHSAADGFDWKVGDNLFIATSTIQQTHSEYRTIKAITGDEITLDKALDYYHYGMAEADYGAQKTYYNGVDIRNEVLLLNRNIIVKGEEKDAWPGHVLITDLFESDGKKREGYIIANNVEFQHVSQKDVGKGGIRWEGNTGSDKTVSIMQSSTVHGGQDWGISLISANNVEVKDNVFVGWRAIGARLDSTRNVTFTGNFVGDVRGRGIAFTGMTIDKEACITVGGYLEKGGSGTTNHDLTFQDNIAAGCEYAGIVAPAYVKCGDADNKIKNNVAHSSSRYGYYAYKNPVATDADTCVEWGYVSAYKTQEACAVSVVKTKTQKAHHITCIDVQEGLSVNYGGEETEEADILIEDSIFFGESEAQDCPEKKACHCKAKFAFMNGHINRDGKDLHPTSASALPITKSKAQGCWGGKVTANRLTFKKFIGKSKCGQRSVIFQANKNDSDKIPQHYFNDFVFEDVDDSGWAFLEKPPTKWANVKDCGNFPCTAPNNFIMSFSGTKFQGTTKPSSTPADFVIVPDDPTVGGTYPGCKHFVDQQIYVCQLNNIGLMQFENLDDDAWDRAVQPVFIKNDETGFNNTLNAMMDHIWDTFYTGQKRLARFPGAILTGQDYTLEFSGTPPKKIRINLEARTGGTKIRIPYPNAGSYAVSKGDKMISPKYERVDNNAWDDKIQAQGNLQKKVGKCGENRFVGVENYLEFWLEAGCDLMIQPKDSIQAKVRMDWSMSEFFADGGTTRFVDRLAASLGIDSFRIKVVSIYEGSVVVDFNVEQEEVKATKDDGSSKTAEEIAAEQAAKTAALASVKTTMTQQADAGTLNIGAPVMGLATVEVAADGSSEMKLQSGDPIPEAPSKNPDLSSLLTPGEDGAVYGLASAMIAFIALAVGLF